MTEQQNLFGINQHNKDIPANATEIEFGIGKIHVVVIPGSSIVVQEFVDAINNVAMTVPLHKLVEAINKINRFS